MIARKPTKPTGKKGLVPQLKAFLTALGERYQHALTVIDEALVSDNFKDKIWAVDWILKRSATLEPETIQPEKNAGMATTGNAESRTLSPEELAQLSDAELMEKIRTLLHHKNTPDP